VGDEEGLLAKDNRDGAAQMQASPSLKKKMQDFLATGAVVKLGWFGSVYGFDVFFHGQSRVIYNASLEEGAGG
jgi:hypothetical protein